MRRSKSSRAQKEILSRDNRDNRDKSIFTGFFEGCNRDKRGNMSRLETEFAPGMGAGVLGTRCKASLPRISRARRGGFEP